MSRQDRDWRVDSYRRETRHGVFFINVNDYVEQHTTLVRVWGESPNLQAKPLGAFASVEAAKGACDACIAELEEQRGRCECGVALAHFTGAGASGVLCPVCDADHANELLEVMP